MPLERTKADETYPLPTSMQPTALAVRQADELGDMMARAIVPRNLDDVARLSMAASKSGLFGCRSADDAFVRIATGLELGIGAMTALRTISVVSGKPVLDATLIAGLVQRSPDCAWWRITETTDVRCTIETSHRRNGVQRLSYTIEQAKQAGLTGKDNWRHYPAAMLRARATAALARMAYPGVCAGLYSPDELGDTTAPIEMPMAVVAAEQPKPTAVIPASEPPPVPVSEPPLATPTDVAAMRDTIAMASTPKELLAMGMAIKQAKLGRSDRARLREAYAARQASFKPPSRPRAEPTDDDERAAIEGEGKERFDEPMQGSLGDLL